MSANRFSRKITARGVKNSHEQSRAAPFPFSWNLRDGDGIGGGSIEVSGGLPFPARMKTSIRRCPPFWKSATLRSSAGYRAENIPAKADVVVIGNAIKRGNPEAEAVLNRKLFYLSLPEVLKNYFLRGRHNLVVTGTHGKTTTTALLAWIMESAKHKPSYMIGGIPAQFRTGRTVQRIEILRHRRRRIRHRFFRQALQVYSLPAGAADRE